MRKVVGLCVLAVVLVGIETLGSGLALPVVQGFQRPKSLQGSEIFPVARILEITGTVRLWDSVFSEERLAAPFGTIYSNEQLRISENSSVTLVLRGAGQVERVAVAGQYRVTNEGCLPRQGVEKLAMPEKTSATIRRASAGNRGIIAGAVVIAQTIAPKRMTEQVESQIQAEKEQEAREELEFGLINPAFNSTVLGPQIQFSWPAKSGARGYTVELLQNAEILWSGSTNKTSINCEPQTPLRPASQYTWRVSCELSGHVSRIVNSQFRVANEQQEKLFAELLLATVSADRIPLMIAAMWMRQNGFYQEAIESYERLILIRPDVPTYENLVDLYWEINDSAKADAAQKRMEELQRQSPPLQP